MPSYTRIIVPYLMGQYRAGLERISTLDPNGWEILRISNLIETDTNLDEKMANMSSIYRTLAEKIQSVVEGGSVPIVIAGDCVASLGVLTGLQHAQKQPNNLLWLDAHGDYNGSVAKLNF